MKKMILAMVVLCGFAVAACVIDEDASTASSEICTAECATYVGEVWQACVDAACGGSTGGDGGGGGGYGGGSGGTGGATCVYLRVDHCWGDFWQTVDWCCYSSGASLTCYAAGRGCEYAPAP